MAGKIVTKTQASKRVYYSFIAAMAVFGCLGLSPRAQANVLLSNPLGAAFARSDRAINRLTRLMDELVGDGIPVSVQPLWRKVVQQQEDMTQPVMDSLSSFRVEAHEFENNYVLRGELPGVQRENIRIAFLQDNVLAITAEKKNLWEVVRTEAAATAENSPPETSTAASDAAAPTTTAAAAAAAPVWPKTLIGEVSYGKFYRSFKLPLDANTEESTASFENGILTISLPKREKPKEKVIEIK